MNERSASIFDQFTGKYELSKTLRFELKPVGKTRDFLKSDKVFEKDKTIDKSYRQAKFYFDELHREFVKDALSVENFKGFSLDEFVNVWKEYKKKRDKDKNSANKILWDAEKKLRKAIAKKINDKAKEKYGKEGIKFLLSAKVLNLLKEKFPSEDNDRLIQEGKPSLFVDSYEEPNKNQYIFDSFDNKTGYLLKFQKTRENLYKDDGTRTAITTRLVSNFRIFLQNIDTFENHHKTISDFVFTEEEKDMFVAVNYFDFFLQEGIDKYNEVIGSFNKQMKELRDKHEKDIDFSKNKYPLLKTLEKQILGKVVKEKQLIESDEGVFQALRDYIDLTKTTFDVSRELIDDLAGGNFSDEDLSGIYLNRRSINTISRKWLVDGFSFELGLTPEKDRKKKNEESTVKVPQFVSLVDIFQVLENLENENVFKEEFDEVVSGKKTRSEQFIAILRSEFFRLYEGEGRDKSGYVGALSTVKKIIERDPLYIRSKEQIESIKDFADISLFLFQLMGYFSIEAKKLEDKPVSFSIDFYERYEKIRGDESEKPLIVRYYDALRNYLTKKPGDESKIKINFDNGHLLTGWDKNKEKEKLGIILRKGGNYYLGILKKGFSDIFDESRHSEAYSASTDFYEKMEYKLFPDPKRMIPKIAFADLNKEEFGWTQEIQAIKDEYARFQEAKKNDKDLWKDQFDKSKTSRLIGYYQHCLEIGGYAKTFGFSWRSPESYRGIGEFNDEIASQNYKLNFVAVGSEYVDRAVESGKLFLFGIHNRDMSPKSTGKKNIHTLLFLEAFSLVNLEMKPPVIQLAGNAEIFLRESSEQVEMETRKFSRKISKYRRYTEDKLFFHLPISIGGKTESINNQSKFNKNLNKNIIAPNRKKMAVIGIDRGEKHLAYYSVVNHKGQIIDQGSLNVIKGPGGREVDYFQILRDREKERLKNRQSWQSVRQIKDLKRGYISQVVKKIIDLIVQYNAIVVLEDLNMRFKQVRGGIESSVYQQLEKALIQKLGYLVFKNRPSDVPGGILKGYQLAAPFESFEKMGKQTGVLFYTQAEYTSKTDPLTGFRKNVYISNSLSVGEVKNTKGKTLRSEFSKIKIGWDDRFDSYFFEYFESDFALAAKKNSKVSRVDEEPIRVYANVPRIKREKNKKTGYWEYAAVNPNKLLREMFERWDFEQLEAEDMTDQIWEKDDAGMLRGEREFDGRSRNFFKSLAFIFNLVLEMRNSYSTRVVYEKNEDGQPMKDKDGKLKVKIEGEDVDFIASPVYPFFQTRIEGKKFQNDEFSEFLRPRFSEMEGLVKGGEKERILREWNGDANGAYNIARKGLIILDRIEQDPENPDLYVSKEQWDEFTKNMYRETKSMSQEIKITEEVR